MIKYLKIEGLNGNTTPLEFNFNNDLNLFTGLNGCGKTTVLKILWFVNSGNLHDLTREIIFQEIKVCSDNYEVEIKKKDETFLAECKRNGKLVFKFEDDINLLQRRVRIDYRSLFQPMSENSIFFPTFRRIEGGFSMETRGFRYRKETFPLKEALSDLSEELSSKGARAPLNASVILKSDVIFIKSGILLESRLARTLFSASEYGTSIHLIFIS